MDNFNPIPNANMNLSWIPRNLATASWTNYDHKLFENALVEFPEGVVDRWQKIAYVCGKTLDDVWAHYEALVHDVSEIESGRVELPNYADEAFQEKSPDEQTESRGMIMYHYDPIPNANMVPYWIRSNHTTDSWIRYEHKLFEEALVKFPEDDVDRWQKIADACSKTLDDVRVHYEALVLDVSEIDSGRVELPIYSDEAFGSEQAEQPGSRTRQISIGSSGKTKHKFYWTEAQHKLFLIGLEKYGKGDWRGISRNVVATKTPTQVASHAQKYFLRQTSVKVKSSILDKTTPLDTETVPPPNDFTNQEGENGLNFPDKR